MPETLLLIALALLCTLLVVLLIIFRRPAGDAGRDLLVRVESLKNAVETVDRLLREESARSREASDRSAQQDREEIQRALRASADSLQARLAEIASLQRGQLDSFAAQLGTVTQTTGEKLDRVRDSVEGKLASIQADNSLQLEKMRETVDEKLKNTLEQRLGESFRHVSERLEQVQLGLGEMRALATGVGDLKKVLSNVRTRGTWGEVQLGALLEQILTREQYEKNVATKSGSNDRVEFALKLPGRDDQGPVWLPIDAKFPQEDYQRLVEASEQANPLLLEESAKQLENRIRLEAKTIRDKYIDPPHTTDFAIMFLPTEGLYAEVLRRPGLTEDLQRTCRVNITGPTTLAALLNSLQMGFRTLAIEKRSGEVWALLGAVKTEFGKFGDVLDKTHKKLQEASNTIESAATRTRQIERKLRNVQGLPPGESVKLLGGDPVPREEEDATEEGNAAS
ncbi:MAG TPA: DNA recombination protein RmuC [Bacteroidota bacterium]|nr:DNA recombination protein RmuC [Bacteroidota bacterium]